MCVTKKHWVFLPNVTSMSFDNSVKHHRIQSNVMEFNSSITLSIYKKNLALITFKSNRGEGEKSRPNSEYSRPKYTTPIGRFMDVVQIAEYSEATIERAPYRKSDCTTNDMLIKMDTCVDIFARVLPGTRY